FFQAEDGIRDLIVTGVQTCALPICPDQAPSSRHRHQLPDPAEQRGGEPERRGDPEPAEQQEEGALLGPELEGEKDEQVHRQRRRSEERRVGKECRCAWWREEEKK